MRAVEVAVTWFSVYFLIWFQAATANFISSFQRIITLDDLVHTHDTEFHTEMSEARSVLECARLCCSHSYCVTFTYVTDDVIEEDVVHKRPCRGYSTELTSKSGNATTVTRARTYRKIHKGTLRNVAVHKRATQSNTYEGKYGFAHLAVDGNLNPAYRNGSCAHTTKTNGTMHWWQVDLAATFSVFSVTITNRGDCCADRLRDFDINIYSEDPMTNPIAFDTLCHHYNGPMEAGVTEDLPCYNAPISGRFVRVSKNGKPSLTLCEVQVMAVPFNE